MFCRTFHLGKDLGVASSDPDHWPVPVIATERLAHGLGRKRAGAHAVEFALIAPVFFLLIFGIVEFGRALMTIELLTESARLGCRQGVVEGTTTQQIKDTAVNFLTSVGVQGDLVNVIINDGQGNVAEAQDVPPYTEITVVVTVPAASVSWIPNAMYPSGNLTGQWTMRRE
jgi:Flp pilus assembly protein TadG